MHSYHATVLGAQPSTEQHGYNDWLQSVLQPAALVLCSTESRVYGSVTVKGPQTQVKLHGHAFHHTGMIIYSKKTRGVCTNQLHDLWCTQADACSSHYTSNAY
jgi:hypothetical protein